MNGGKKLFLMRHAKSAWPDFEISDFDRPLLADGITEIKKIVQASMNDLSLLELIIASPAVRTMQTATILCDTLGLPLQRVVENIDLYLPIAVSISTIVKKLPKDIGIAMIISHNPGLSDFVNRYLSKQIGSMSTASIVCLRFNAETWASISSDNLVDSWVEYPGKF